MISVITSLKPNVSHEIIISDFYMAKFKDLLMRFPFQNTGFKDE